MTKTLSGLAVGLFLLAGPLLHAQQAPAAGPNRASLPPEVLASLESHLDLTYATYGDRSLQLDLYRPADAAAPLPGIVCIHGGGWAKGDRTSHTLLAQALAAQGYVAVTISYRLSGEAPFPAAIHDCKAAVRWMRANAATYGIDPDQIGAIGLSAGGHLTALLATSAGIPDLEGEGGNPGFSSAIQAAVPMGAQTDTETDRIRQHSAAAESGLIWRQFLGGSLEEAPDTYRLASPVQHLDATDPPQLLMSGENDDPSTHGTQFRNLLEELDLDTGLVLLPGAPHAFVGQAAHFEPCVRAAASFFDLHLKGPGTLTPLLNGSDLTGLQTTGNWVYEEDGTLAIRPREGETGWKRYDAYLWAEAPFGDFVTEVEYMHPEGGNSGVFLRCANLEDPVTSGLEVQILDSYGKPSEEMTHHDCGGVIKTSPPARNASKPAGEWNRMRITARGPSLQVVLNGILIQDLNLDETDSRDKPLQGFVGLQDHGQLMWFRNWRIARFD